VSRALAHVEWIEQKTIQADRGTRRVTIEINDKKQFNLDALSKSLPERYRSGLKVLEGP
jgi:hypothetical protein